MAMKRPPLFRGLELTGHFLNLFPVLVDFLAMFVAKVDVLIKGFWPQIYFPTTLVTAKPRFEVDHFVLLTRL